ncbi:hypothetical protein PVIIG_05453 [Plasmodium vivax India VII]|uniref:Uncharacterized protein n=1 Tax=Plasmodium vivax India VII TaxID=1077284 RepID=A0A0J9S1G4_PLAVI|nr:hypothetical protein PVIIG_05453 [Plasmodium vivax India VII]
MAEISEKELEDILKDLPAHEIYSELNEHVQSDSRFVKHCKKMHKFENNNDEMINLCKKIARNLEKLSGILSNNAKDVKCSYFNHWMYNEIWKLVRTESNYEIDKDAILKLASIGFDINWELSRDYCSYEYYKDEEFSDWKKMKNLHDYFKNFDQIKEKIQSAGDKYEKYSKYIKYISKIYDDYEDECCDSDLDKDEFAPIYFNCDEVYHPKKLLELLESNQATSGVQTRVKSLNELNTQGEASDDIALENDSEGDVSRATNSNELKKDEFKTPDQPVITNGENSQYSALASTQKTVNDTCQYVDSLDHNPRNINCKPQETSNASDQEDLQENIEQASDSLPEATEQIKDQSKKGKDTEGSVTGEVTSLTLQVDRHSEQRGNAYVHESGFSSRAVQNGHTPLSYSGWGKSYTSSLDTREEEHNLLEPLGSQFSSILGILKNNFYSISIVSSASIGLIILLLVYYKVIIKYPSQYKKCYNKLSVFYKVLIFTFT